MVNVIRGDLKNKPVSSKRLADYFERQDDIDGTLYLGYPIIGASQGGYQIDALLVSKPEMLKLAKKLYIFSYRYSVNGKITKKSSYA